MNRFWSFLRALAPAVLCAFSFLLLGYYLGGRFAKMGYGTLLNNGLMLSLGLVAIYVALSKLYFRLRTSNLEKKMQYASDEIFKLQCQIFNDEDIPDRISVNAALDNVVQSQGQDTAAIATVLKFASRIKPAQPKWRELVTRKPPKGSFRGLTQEMGEIEIKEDRPESPQIQGGLTKERVGQYKLWRHLNIVIFQYFWEAEICTATHPLDAFNGYAILFRAKTFEQSGYGILGHKILNYGRKPKVLLHINFLTGKEQGKRIPYGFVEFL